MTRVLHRFADRDAMCEAVARELLAVLTEAVETHGSAHAVLTGGGAGIGILDAAARLVDTERNSGRNTGQLAEHAAEHTAGQAPVPEWSQVHFWWGDERLLAGGEAERNDEQADAALLRRLVAEHGLPEENIHRMPSTELAVSPAQGAEAYSADLAAFADDEEDDEQRARLLLPRFDVLLLGVGPDGHVASLFPGRDSLTVSGVCCVGESDSPKPPPSRVSLTFDAISTAERVWMVVAGQDKAVAVARAFTDGTAVEEIPAVGALGRAETVWHIDQAAGSALTEESADD